MELSKGVYLLFSIVLLRIIFFVTRFSIFSDFVSEKKFQTKSQKILEDLFKGLKMFYHIEERCNKLFIRTERIDDLGTKKNTYWSGPKVWTYENYNELSTKI